MITAAPRVALAVRDMDHAITTFRNLFGMPVYELQRLREELGIRMALCAPPTGAHIELMAPLDSRALSNSLNRCLDRRGEGFFALMLYAPDPDAEAETLVQRGLPVMPLMPEAQGRDIHPKHTRGVLIRIYPSWSGPDLERELEGALGPAPQRESSAHLTGIQRVIIAVDDLDAATRVYRDRLGLPALPGGFGDASGIRSAVCAPESGAHIELVTPSSTPGAMGREIAHFLEKRGEGMFALVLGSDDLEATRRALAAGGIEIRPSSDDRGRWEIPTEAAFGARIRIEERLR